MVIICTPTRDTIQSGTVFDLVELIKYSPDTSFAVSKGTILPNQRTELVRKCIEAHVTHVFFIDSDMRFPKDALERLIKHDVDVVGANCKHRQANKWTADTSSKGKTGIKEVKKIGFGVTLIKMKVFFTIQPPWFATPYDGSMFVTDDVFFCKKAVDSGFKIFIDHDLSQDVKHIGTKEY